MTISRVRVIVSIVSMSLNDIHNGMSYLRGRLEICVNGVGPPVLLYFFHFLYCKHYCHFPFSTLHKRVKACMPSISL
uniref:Uncharacterized protein n=1 Tax=Parascaris equorum TaxID=6256 RepID=A0A914S3U8_PAREQ